MASLTSFITVAIGLTFYIVGATQDMNLLTEHELFREYNTSVSETGTTCAQFGILPASVEPCGE